MEYLKDEQVTRGVEQHTVREDWAAHLDIWDEDISSTRFVCVHRIPTRERAEQIAQILELVPGCEGITFATPEEYLLHRASSAEMQDAVTRLVATLPQPALPELAQPRRPTRLRAVEPGSLLVMPLPEPHDDKRYTLALRLPDGKGFMFAFDQLCDPCEADLVNPEVIWDWDADPDAEAVVLADGLTRVTVLDVLGIDYRRERQNPATLPGQRNGIYPARTCARCHGVNVDVCCTEASYDDDSADEPSCIDCCKKYNPHR